MGAVRANGVQNREAKHPTNVDHDDVEQHSEDLKEDMDLVNGNATIDANLTQDVSKEASGASKDHENRQSIRRLWFVRLPPKPTETAALRALELETEAFKVQSRLINETLTIKKMDRDAARDELRSARDALRLCKDECEAKYSHIEKLREQIRSSSGGGSGSRPMREEYKDLPVHSTAELNTKIAALQNRIQHESKSSEEEKKIIASIKRLESQRHKVQEYEALVSKSTAPTTTTTSTHFKFDKERALSEIIELEAQLKVLKGERDTQAAIVSKFKEKVDALEQDVDVILGEKRRVKDLQDAAYNKASELRQQQRETNSEYHENRKFSREVREMITAGKLDEAKEACAEQMQALHSRLESDSEFRKDYYSAWQLHRESQAALAVFSEAEQVQYQDHPEQQLAASAPVQVQVKSGTDSSEEPVLKAQKLIEAVLQEADQEIKARHAATAAVHSKPTAVGGSQLHSNSLTNEAGHSNLKPPSTSAQKAKSHSRSKKNTSSSSSATFEQVHNPVDPIPAFELPDVVKKSSKSQQQHFDKEAERERNRRAQEEAEQRKLKREAERIKRRERASAVANHHHNNNHNSRNRAAVDTTSLSSASPGHQAAVGISKSNGSFSTTATVNTGSGIGVTPLHKVITHQPIARRPRPTTSRLWAKELQFVRNKWGDILLGVVVCVFAGMVIMGLISTS